jgi:hypothetical protein
LRSGLRVLPENAALRGRLSTTATVLPPRPFFLHAQLDHEPGGNRPVPARWLHVQRLVPATRSQQIPPAPVETSRLGWRDGHAAIMREDRSRLSAGRRARIDAAYD